MVYATDANGVVGDQSYFVYSSIPTSLMACGNITNTTSIHYTFLDGETFAPVNATYIISTTDTFNQTTNLTGMDTQLNICVFPPAGIVVAVTSESLSSTGYFSKLQSRTLGAYSSIVTNYPIYLFNSSSNTTKVTQITVITYNNVPVPNVFVNIQQQNITSGTYYQIDSLLTNPAGTVQSVLTPNSIFYKFTVKAQDGSVLSDYVPQLITCGALETTCLVTLTILNITPMPYLSNFEFTNASCNWTNTTGNLNCTPHGSPPNSTNLLVSLVNSTTYNATICNNNGIGNATVVCMLPVTPGNCYSFAFTAIINGSKSTLGGGMVCINTPAKFVPNAGIGILITFILVGTLALLGMAFAPSGCFVGAAFGLLIACAFSMLTGVIWFAAIMGALGLLILAWVVK
jgi:hypothetical protein